MQQLDKLPPGEKIALSTVLFEGTKSDDSTSSGTCFSFLYTYDNASIQCLVTNRHVVEDVVDAYFYFHRKSGSFIRIEVSDFTNLWMPHPDNSIDLCVIPTLSLFKHAEKQGHELLTCHIPDNIIPNSDYYGKLGSGENALIVGYPNGLFDTTNNKPILRRGICATSPCIDFLGHPSFLVDAATVPGCSGSPVFLFDTSGYFENGNHIIGQRILLIGILSDWIPYPATGKPANAPHSEFVVNTDVPLNLGRAIRADQLLGFKPALFDKYIKGRTTDSHTEAP